MRVNMDFLRRPAGWLAAGLVSVLAMTGLASAQGVLERAREGGKVTIAVAGEAPYGYRGPDGEITGEAPEIARAVLARLAPDAELSFVTVEFGALIPGLRDGSIDIAAAGMFITPARCGEVAFSNPTYVVGEAFAVKAGNPKGLTDFATVSDNEEARVGLIAGTVEYNYALVTGIPADRAPLYRDFDLAMDALKAGEIDAVALTALTAKDLVDGEDGLEATPQFYPVLDGEQVKGYGGFAFRKEDRDLADAFNGVLADFIGSPDHLALVEPFGFTEDMMPDMTAKDLCEG